MRTAKLITLFSITGVYFFSMFQRVAVPGTIFNELQSEFAASAAAIAALGAIYLYIYGGMQLLAGVLSDSIGASKTLFAGGIILSAGSILFPFSSSTGHLYFSRALVGLGASLIYISMLKHINISFSEKNFPLVFACSIIAGYSGGLAATYPLEKLSSFTGWQTSMLLAGGVCLFFVILSGLRLRRTFNYRNCAFSPRAVRKIFANKTIFPVMASGGANFSVYFILQAAIGKKMLEDFAGLSSSHAAAFTFSMMLISMGSVMFHGLIGIRNARRKPFAVTSSCVVTSGALLILINLIFFKNPALFLPAYLMCAFAGGNILNATLVKELNPPEAAATAVGIYNGAMYSSVAITTNIAGVVMDSFSADARITEDATIIYPDSAYIAIFSGCLLLGVISIFCSSIIREKRPSDGIEA